MRFGDRKTGSASSADNPYADSLRGLKLTDPVASFFTFCAAREQLRARRAEGAEPPWTDDPVLQHGRFLNVFREDDRGSRAVAHFVAPVADNLPALVQALFFARWCNAPTTLDAISARDLEGPASLRHRLQLLPQQPWCNVAAYPVEPVQFCGRTYSRLDTATELFARLANQLTALIEASGKDVRVATAAVNDLLQMKNDFPIFMAVMDLARWRPDVVDPDSDVPTGIGAAPYMDLLQRYLGAPDHHATARKVIALQPRYWPQARRALHPIDIEFICCECRKYYSYINGTKQPVGKNRFSPGVAARLLFDLPEDVASHAPTPTGIVVLAGAPGSGKTSLLTALAKRGYRVVPETAEVLLRAGLSAGVSASRIRAEPLSWQRSVLWQDYEVFSQLPADALLLTDTSIAEDLVYAARAGVEVGPRYMQWAKTLRYRAVFFLQPLANYETTQVRLESQQLAQRLCDEVRRMYKSLDYKVLDVPAMSLPERVAFVEKQIGQLW